MSASSFTSLSVIFHRRSASTCSISPVHEKMDYDSKLEKCKAHVESLLSQRGHAGLRVRKSTYLPPSIWYTVDFTKETSYPSRSLHFLKPSSQNEPFHNTPPPIQAPLNPSHTSSKRPLQAHLPLKILISGAGLAGLATAIALRRRGHTVTVFEKAPELGEVHLLSFSPHPLSSFTLISLSSF